MHIVICEKNFFDFKSFNCFVSIWGERGIHLKKKPTSKQINLHCCVFGVHVSSTNPAESIISNRKSIRCSQIKKYFFLKWNEFLITNNMKKTYFSPNFNPIIKRRKKYVCCVYKNFKKNQNCLENTFNFLFCFKIT